MQSSIQPLLTAAIVALTLTGCRFNGDFIGYQEANADMDAGSAGHWSPSSGGHGGQHQSGGQGGAISSNQGGAGAGGMSGGDTGGDPNGLSCSPACAAGLTCCGGYCVDLQYDVSHCGSCGNACTGSTGATCVAGCCVGGDGSGGQGGMSGGPEVGGQGGETQGGSGADPVAGQGGDGDEPPIAGEGGDDDPPVAGGGGDDDPPIAGQSGGDDDPPIAGQGDDEPEAGQGGAGQGGVGGEPQAGQGGAGQGGTGGQTSTEPLHDIEITLFAITHNSEFLSITVGEVLKGTVTFHNPNDRPFPIDQIVIAGRPPGGTNAGGPYLDLIPAIGGPTTIEANGNISYTATRTMLDTDPLGVWRIYPTWEADGMFHDGNSLNIEVRPVLDQEWGTFEPEVVAPIDYDPTTGTVQNERWACWNAIGMMASDGTQYPSCTVFGWQSFGEGRNVPAVPTCPAGTLRLSHLCPQNPMWLGINGSVGPGKPEWSDLWIYAPTEAEATILRSDFPAHNASGLTTVNSDYKGK